MPPPTPPMHASPDKRADRTTLEGMIFNANHVLDSALNPQTPGLPRDIFAKCKGIVLISVLEAGFIFSGNVGSGVVMSRSEEDGTWSNPSAIGLAGMGWGFLFGAEIKDIMMLIMDSNTLHTFLSAGQIKFGGQAGIAIGPLGREADLSLQLGTTGGGSTLSYTFSKGLFAGVGVEGAIIASRMDENERFYGRKVLVDDILIRRDVTAPEGSGISELHEKLGKLAAGETHTEGEEELKGKESLKESINKAAESIRSTIKDIVYIDASMEAEADTTTSKTGG